MSDYNLREALEAIAKTTINTPQDLSKILKRFPRNGGGIYSKDQLVHAYQHLIAAGELEENPELLSKIRMKPTRSISGVLPVTVLTRPYPCPGRCIFCPNDIRMPKSYLSDEPGAQRAERNNFDPYLQTYNRLLAYQKTGHELSKVELIILGGTWSFYPELYQIWFIKRCFDALNDFGAKDGRNTVATQNPYLQSEKSKPQFANNGRRKSYNELVTAVELKTIRTKHAKLSTINQETATWEDLLTAQKLNEQALSRCVGLVIETRPDNIDEAEVIRVRKLGATKTQIGFQSLQDEVLELNHRGHDVNATISSVKLVRSAGFKIHAHWMPNLYGSTPEKDKADYLKLWTKDFQPDELKIYPCSLIETAELMDYYEKGLWKPYTEAELLNVLSFCFQNTPRYVRLTRVIRDIPSTDIVVGNKKTNFRQIVDNHLQKLGHKVVEIRNREIKSTVVTPDELRFKDTNYQGQTITGTSEEHFLEFTNKEDKICGFLRLSLPKKYAKNKTHFIPELNNAAIIREIHVYGTVRKFGEQHAGSAQHLGLGKQLIGKAVELAKERGYTQLSVISAIGTREYYRKQGFSDGDLYQHLDIN